MDGASKGAAAITVGRPAIVPGPDGSLPIGQLTQAGVVLGTPLYMSPEQHLGDPTDPRSDQFSFCVALYEALYRQLPFAGNTLESLAFNTISGRVLPRPADSQVPSTVHKLLLRGLSVEPSKRWPSMQELLAALLADPSADRSAGPRSRRKVTLGLLAYIAIATIGMKLLRSFGVGELAASIATGIAFMSVFVVLAILFRRVLGHPFHRGTLVYGSSYATHVLALRLIGMSLGLSYSQVVTIDLMTLAVISAVGGALVMRGLWLIVPLGGLGALVAALRPEYAVTLSSAITALATVTALYLWNRTVVKRRRNEPGS